MPPQRQAPACVLFLAPPNMLPAQAKCQTALHSQHGLPKHAWDQSPRLSPGWCSSCLIFSSTVVLSWMEYTRAPCSRPRRDGNAAGQQAGTAGAACMQAADIWAMPAGAVARACMQSCCTGAFLAAVRRPSRLPAGPPLTAAQPVLPHLQAGGLLELEALLFSGHGPHHIRLEADDHPVGGKLLREGHSGTVWVCV